MNLNSFMLGTEITIKMNYNNKRFRTVLNSKNGETSAETIFIYKQEGNILTSTYNGGQIINGHLIGLVDSEGNIEMRYHQVNKNGKLMTGICYSTPEIMSSGKIKLYENWQWTSGDKSKGKSILAEI